MCVSVCLKRLCKVLNDTELRDIYIKSIKYKVKGSHMSFLLNYVVCFMNILEYTLGTILFLNTNAAIKSLRITKAV